MPIKNQTLSLLIMGAIIVGSVWVGMVIYREAKITSYALDYYEYQGITFRPTRLSRPIAEDGSFIRLLGPNGGKKLKLGESSLIFWEYSGEGSFVLALQKDGANAAPLHIISVVYKDQLAGEGQIRRGVYDWNVGELADGTWIEPSTGWKILVASESRPDEVYDLSDSFLAITE